MSVRPRLMRLNWSHFAVLSVGVALVVFVIVSLWEPWLGDMYAYEIGLPAMGKRYGFTYGAIQFPGRQYPFFGIVNLDRDGVLARSGLRVHDAPWPDGHWAFYEALCAVDRGERASVDVISLDAWTTTGDLTRRRIEIPAPR